MRFWKGYAKKVTPGMVEEMRRMRERGATYAEIAERFGLRPSTVQYHLSPRYRMQAKERARRYRGTKDRERKRAYMREYMRERYRSDPEFRARIRRFTLTAFRKMVERNRSVRLPAGAAVECPYCGRVWRPRVPWIPSACPGCGAKLFRPPRIVGDAFGLSGAGRECLPSA